MADHEYGGIIQAGISKVNYYTAMAKEATANLRKRMARACEDVACHHIVSWNIELYTAETQKLLELLGCRDKAPRSDSRVSEETVRAVVEEILKALGIEGAT